MENVKRYKYKSDIKDHIYENESVKVVNHSSGYSFTLSTNSLEYDYSFSELRCKYFFDDCVLTTSFEDKNPYPDRDKDDPKRGWEIYLDEWIIRYISNEEFLQVNNISIIKETVHSYEFLKDYELVNFSYFINDCKNYDYPYYNIAIIRKLDNYKEFYLFVSARIFSGVIDTLIMFVGIDILKISDLIIKVFANVVVVIINYIFSKLIIFRKEVKNEVN